jgi:hypothetical protein
MYSAEDNDFAAEFFQNKFESIQLSLRNKQILLSIKTI